MQVKVSGALLAVEQDAHPGAAGVPVLFLHANVADRRMWRASCSWLASFRPAISYDRRGFGESRTLAPMPHSHVADLWSVMDALGYEQAVLVGCSMGGRIAIDAAMAQPARVGGLVLVSPGVGGAPTPEPVATVKELMDTIHATASRGDLDAKNELQAQLWLDGPLSPPGRVGGEARSLFLSMNGTALRAPHPGVAVEEPSAWARLESIQAPTTVLWGDLDLPHLQDRCRLLAQRIPAAQGTMLPGVAHLPSLEAPEQFNTALQRCLAGL